jgi:TolA-binding protein
MALAMLLAAPGPRAVRRRRGPQGHHRPAPEVRCPQVGRCAAKRLEAGEAREADAQPAQPAGAVQPDRAAAGEIARCAVRTSNWPAKWPSCSASRKTCRPAWMRACARWSHQGHRWTASSSLPSPEKSATSTRHGSAAQVRLSGAAAAYGAVSAPHPGSGYTPSVLYWLGNAQYANRAYKERSTATAPGARSFPSHADAEAMLAMANSQVELKDSKAAPAHAGRPGQAAPAVRSGGRCRERLARLR